MNVIILTLNHPNSNGRIYPETEVSKRLPTELLIYDFCGENNSLEQVVGVARHFKIENDNLMAAVTFFENEKAKILENKLSSGSIAVRTACIAEINRVGVVSNPEFQYAFTTASPSL